jgi:hypothetical protein
VALAGEKAMPVSSVAGCTVRDAVAFAPERLAVIVTGVLAATPDVVTEKVALVVPAPTVIVTGTDAAALLLLESATVVPPVGAGPFSVRVAVTVVPEVTTE